MKTKTYYAVVATYPGFPDFPSPKRFDERLEKHLRKESTGSGCGFGGRDIVFDYATWEKAKAAAAKIRAYAKKEKDAVYRKTTVRIYKEELY